MKSLDEKVIEQIKKLLNLTESKGATEHEAATAVAMAQKLALKHGLNLQELSVEEETEQVVSESVTISTTNAVEWKVGLVSALAYANGCYCFWKHGEMKGNRHRITVRRSFIVVGTEFNRFVVVESFKYLESVVESLAEEDLYDTERRIRIKELVMPQELNRREFLSAFRVGCSNRLQERIKESTKQVAEQGTENCTAIVVANYLLESRKNAKEWANKQYNLTSGKPKAIVDRSDRLGYRLGREAADSVNLSPQKELK